MLLSGQMAYGTVHTEGPHDSKIEVYAGMPTGDHQTDERKRQEIRQGPLRLAMRLGWPLLFIVIVILLVLAIQKSMATYDTPGVVPASLRNAYTITYAYTHILDIVTILCSTIVALYIFCRRPHEWLYLLTSVSLLLTGFMYNPLLLAVPAPSELIALLAATGEVCHIAMLLFFPDGRGNRRLLWLVLLPTFVWRFLIWDAQILPHYLQGQPSGPLALLYQQPLTVIGIISIVYIIVGLKFYRQQHIFTLVQKQHMRWLLFSLLLVLVCLADYYFILHVAINLQSLHPDDLLVQMLSSTVWHLIQIQVPLAALAALAGHRLWDADRMISRTLSYGLLIFLLSLIYWLSALVLQHILYIFTSYPFLESSGATLIVTILFHPLRIRLEQTIDRYFYPRTYDAIQLVEQLGDKLRQETDLDEIVKQLSTVIEETMEPTHISVWIRPTEPRKLKDKLPPLELH